MPTIETSEHIDAPPEKVWRILTDLGSYPEWNPFIREGSGELRQGQELELKMRPPGGREMTFKPTVLECQGPRELRWLGRLLLPGLFDGEHWFRLTPENGGTRLDQGERFTGILPRFMGKTLAATEQGFTELNLALKQRAEAE
ncbi:MAG: SRPBCC domain-containing protein [Solirubrobacterales bacterium]|nr:SRPBCC domain-containing protein [Solirubrobacterales bacterium]